MIQILESELAAFLPGVSPRSVWRLLRSTHASVGELGARLLSSNFRAEDISLEKLAELANHDFQAVREQAWLFYSQSVPRLKASPAAGLRLLDADWEDSRAFGFRFFSEQLDEDDLSAELLVGIVDSVRPDVQAFGRQLITRHFGEEDGPTYLERLAQHPAPSVELFVTNYLDRYAAGRPERLVALEPYFRRVLSRVNQGRAARERVLAFLDQEIAATPGAAEPIAALLSWLSASGQIGVRAQALTLMLRLRARHPDIALPIQIKAPEVHRAI